jgi:hypothetical protein
MHFLHKQEVATQPKAKLPPLVYDFIHLIVLHLIEVLSYLMVEIDLYECARDRDLYKLGEQVVATPHQVIYYLLDALKNESKSFFV